MIVGWSIKDVLVVNLYIYPYASKLTLSVADDPSDNEIVFGNKTESK